MIKPISGNILIQPIVEDSAWQSSQTQYEERGKVLSVSSNLMETTSYDKRFPLIQVGDIIYFDSWQAARFKDREGKDIWLVHIDAVRAVEKNE